MPNVPSDQFSSAAKKLLIDSYLRRKSGQTAKAGGMDFAQRKAQSDAAVAPILDAANKGDADTLSKLGGMSVLQAQENINAVKEGREPKNMAGPQAAYNQISTGLQQGLMAGLGTNNPLLKAILGAGGALAGVIKGLPQAGDTKWQGNVSEGNPAGVDTSTLASTQKTQPKQEKSSYDSSPGANTPQQPDTTPKSDAAPKSDDTSKSDAAVSTKETPGDQSTEQRQQDSGEGTKTGTLPDAIKSTFSEVSKDIAAEAEELAKAGNDLIATLNSFYSDLFDMIETRRKDLLAQYEKDRREIDPETQMALDDLEQSVKQSLDRVREEANRRGVLDSGIYYADAGGVEKEAIRQRGYIQNTRLKGLRDRLSTALDSLFERKLAVRMDQGQRTYDARQKIIDLGVNARREGRTRLDYLRNLGLQWNRDDALRKEQWAREDAVWHRETEYNDKIRKLERDWQVADENSRRAYEKGNIDEARKWEAEQNRIKREWDAAEAEKDREFQKWQINQQAAQKAITGKSGTASSVNKTQAKNDAAGMIEDMKNKGISRQGAIDRLKATLSDNPLTLQELLAIVDLIYGKETTPKGTTKDPLQ